MHLARQAHKYVRLAPTEIVKPFTGILCNAASRTLAHAVRALTTDQFRKTAFDVEQPLLLPTGFADIPAISKWFISSSHPKAIDPSRPSINHGYLSFRGGSAIVPLELISHEAQSSRDTFTRLDRPLSDLLAYIALREQFGAHTSPVATLYLAQCSLPSLPQALQVDLPTPQLVLEAGRGDIYASSLWLGFAPTATPLHRDPNPNLLVQLCGRKRVRLLSPELGKEVFHQIRHTIGQGSQELTIRGDEMMAGKERDALEEWLWQPGGGFDKARKQIGSAEVWEGEFEAGGAVFIPKGWWHGVRGEGNSVNGSVNWWFR